MEEKRKSGKRRHKASIDDAEESMGIIDRIGGNKKKPNGKRPPGKKMKRR